MNRCCGCGVILQNINEDQDGYVEDLTYKICKRCFIIKNYGQDKTIHKNNADYMEIINKIRDKDFVVYVSNILTLNLDYIDKFKNVILVLTKRDLLPKSVKDNKIINYIKDKYSNILNIIIVSSYKKYNLDKLYNTLMLYKKNSVYFVGITNSGKSTLINEMVKSYNNVQGNITTSAYPSTTLDVINVKIGDLKIKDTPGIIIDNSIVNSLSSSDIKKINSKKEIKPITIQIKGNGAVLIDDYFRIEYETDISSMTFYVSNNLKVSRISLRNLSLSDGIMNEYNIDDNCDLVIEDIGFIKVTNGIKLKIYNKYQSHMYIRKNLI